MRSISEIRKDSKPIILLGDSNNLDHILELCESSGRQVIGMAGSDHIKPNSQTRLSILDLDQCLREKTRYEFFVVTWWFPFNNAVYRASNKRRDALLDCMKQHQLVGATIVHATAVVSPLARIDHHVSVGALSVLVANCQIHRDVNMKEQCYVSHDVTVGQNTMIQIKSTVTGKVCIGSNSYIGVASTIVNQRGYDAMHIGNNVIIHPNQLVVRDVADNTIISHKKTSFVKSDEVDQ